METFEPLMSKKLCCQFKESLKVFQACLNIEDKQKVNGNLQDDCTEYVKDKYQRKSSSIYQKSFLERNLLRVLYKFNVYDDRYADDQYDDGGVGGDDDTDSFD